MWTRDLTPHRNSTPFRSTWTFDMSNVMLGATSGLNAFSSSGTYSSVSRPHRYTVAAASFSFRIVVIFNTGPPSYNTAKLMLVDLQRANSRFQRRGGHTQSSRCTVRPGYAPPSGSQYRFDFCPWVVVRR